MVGATMQRTAAARYIWNHRHQAADIMRVEPPSWHYHMDLGFAIHEAALLKHEAIQ